MADGACAVGERAPEVRLEGPGEGFDLGAARGRTAVLIYAMRSFG